MTKTVVVERLQTVTVTEEDFEGFDGEPTNADIVQFACEVDLWETVYVQVAP